MPSELAMQIATAYLREIDGDAFGKPGVGHDVAHCATIIDKVFGAQRPVKVHWEVEVNEPGFLPYEIGRDQDTLSHAEYYVKQCLVPRLKKRNYKKGTTFTIYRHSTVKTPEQTFQ